MQLVKEINYKKRDWSRDIGVIAAMLGCMLIGIDIWTQEFLAATWLHALIAGLLTFPLHELAHGLLFKVWTGKVKFGAGMTKIGPAFYATSPRARLSRNRTLAITLAPQVLTALYLFLSCLPFIEAVHIVAVLCLVFNFAGGLGDFYVILQILRYPKELQVEDTAMGASFYMPTEEGTSEGIESLS